MDNTSFKTIESCSDNSYRHFIDEIRGIIYCIQKTWNFSYDELCQIIGKDSNYVDNLLFGDINDVCIDTRTLVRLSTLSLGVLKLPGFELSEGTKKDIAKELQAYCDEYHKPELSVEDMTKEILRKVGIKTDEDVKNAYMDIISDDQDWTIRKKCLCRDECKCSDNKDKTEASANCEAYVYDGKDTKKINITTEQVGNLLDSILTKILK